jgi:hypothetical protein
MTPVRIDMLHLAFVGHGPGRDCIGVIDCSVAARREHFLAGRLGATCLIGGAALQECWAAVPTPRDAEGVSAPSIWRGETSGGLPTPRSCLFMSPAPFGDGDGNPLGLDSVLDPSARRSMSRSCQRQSRSS